MLFSLHSSQISLYLLSKINRLHLYPLSYLAVPPWPKTDSKPKRKDTVSQKVLDANRRNLAKANTVPKGDT